MTLLTRPDGTFPEDLQLSRRTALAGAVFTGYAVAALTADAEPIHTDEAGLVTGMVMLPDSTPAYVARPAGEGRHAAILAIHEAFGLHEYIRDVCRRLAKLGYVAIAPAFFVRLGEPAAETDVMGAMKYVNGTPDDATLADIRAAVAFLEKQPYVDASRMGVTGFCWGGRWAWLSCALIPQFKAGVAWYGFMVPTPLNSPLPVEGKPPQTDRLWPSEHVAELHAPVLGLYGGKDLVTQTVPQMRAALAAAGKTDSTIYIYPDALHGFHADYRGNFYNEADAKDGWRRMLAHFAAHGVAPT